MKKKLLKKKYFKIKAKPINDFNYLVNELSKALLKSIERRTLKYFGKKAVFLSGGTDSRMILANSADQNIDAVTLYNQGES
jgi:asparagine synthetase B (glutamine-hydrolysing)